MLITVPPRRCRALLLRPVRRQRSIQCEVLVWTAGQRFLYNPCLRVQDGWLCGTHGSRHVALPVP